MSFIPALLISHVSLPAVDAITAAEPDGRDERQLNLGVRLGDSAHRADQRACYPRDTVESVGVDGALALLIPEDFSQTRSVERRRLRPGVALEAARPRFLAGSPRLATTETGAMASARGARAALGRRCKEIAAARPNLARHPRSGALDIWAERLRPERLESMRR